MHERSTSLAVESTARSAAHARYISRGDECLGRENGKVATTLIHVKQVLPEVCVFSVFVAWRSCVGLA